ncbi:protein kinase gsk3 [Mycena filopes]|nr:protein kinase gsk3 [Mycena filopes]
MYQLFRSLAYIHSASIYHGDVEPHHLLFNPATGIVKLCDFGSAKHVPVRDSSLSSIASRYYRALEVIINSTEYTTTIDIWSAGCVIAELMLGQPIFPGESDVEQLMNITKILGEPSEEQVEMMNTDAPAPDPSPFAKASLSDCHITLSNTARQVFHPSTPPEAIDLVSKLLVYTPTARPSAVEVMVHPFFDELRTEGAQMPNGKPFPPLFNFTRQELSIRPDLIRKLVPAHCEAELASRDIALDSFVPVPPLDVLKKEHATDQGKARRKPARGVQCAL